MNAPLIELVIRAANAIAAVAVFAVLVPLWNMPYAARPLMRFLTVVMAMQAVWRLFILWLGFQTDLGEFGWLVPWVQPMTAALLFLLFLAIGLIAAFHSSRILVKRGS